jgi:hypothetical protein
MWAQTVSSSIREPLARIGQTNQREITALRCMIWHPVRGWRQCRERGVAALPDPREAQYQTTCPAYTLYRMLHPDDQNHLLSRSRFQRQATPYV